MMIKISRIFLVLVMCKLLLLLCHETQSETQIRPPENVTWEKLIPVPAASPIWQEIPTIAPTKNPATPLPETTKTPEENSTIESLDNISPEPLRSPPELRTVSDVNRFWNQQPGGNPMDKLHHILRRYGLNMSQLQDQLQNKRSSGFLSSLTGLIPGLDSLEKLKDMFLPALMDHKGPGALFQQQPPRRVMNVENMRPPSPGPAPPYGSFMRPPNQYQHYNNPSKPGIPTLAQPPELSQHPQPPPLRHNNPYNNLMQPPPTYQQQPDDDVASDTSSSSDEGDDVALLPDDILRVGPVPPLEKHNPIRLKVPNTFHPGNQGLNRLDCDFFTGDICVDVRMYPSDQILTSIRDSPSLLPSLFTDYNTQPDDTHVEGVSPFQELSYNYHHYYGNNSAGTVNRRNGAGDSLAHRHRDFAGDGGFICPSSVRYARPKRARATSGQWKYIVNTKDYVQTLRMEKCLKPRDSCSYVTPHYRSKCSQVYNYHRLLAWDADRNLHMDVFKIPTCCTCHIEGYATTPNSVLTNRRLASSSQFNPNQNIKKNDQSDERFPSTLSMYPRRPLLPSGENKKVINLKPQEENEDSVGEANNIHNKQFLPHFTGGKFQVVPAPPGMVNPGLGGQNVFNKNVNQEAEESQSATVKKEAKVNYSYHPIISYIQKNDVQHSFMQTMGNKRIK